MQFSTVTGLTQATIDKGFALYKAERSIDIHDISQLPSGEFKVIATIEGSRGDYYGVRLNVSQSSPGVAKVNGTCACPVGRNCKHVAALLLELRSTDALGHYGSRSGMAGAGYANPPASPATQATQRTSQTPSQAISQTTSQAPTHAVAHWLQAWERLRETENQRRQARDTNAPADAQHTTAPKSPNKVVGYALYTQYSKLMVRVGQVAQLKSGLSRDFKTNSRTLSEIMNARPSYYDPEVDGSIFRLLHAMNMESNWARDGFEIYGSMALMTLRALQATGRTGVSNPFSRDEWRPIPLTLADDHQALPLNLQWNESTPHNNGMMRGRVSSSNYPARTEPTVEFRLTLAAGEPEFPIVMLPGPFAYDEEKLTLYPVRTSVPESLLQLLARMPTMLKRDIDHVLPQLSAELPPECLTALQQVRDLQVVHEPPRYRLRITRLSQATQPEGWPVWVPDAGLLGDPRVLVLEMQYGTATQWLGVTPNSDHPAWVEVHSADNADTAGRCRYMRDMASEREWLAQYTCGMGSEVISIMLGTESLDGDAADRFFEATAQLPPHLRDPEGSHCIMAAHSEVDWPDIQVNAQNFCQEKGIDLVVDACAAFRTGTAQGVQISVVAGEQGWFDVGYALVIAGRTVQLAPLLTQLLRNNPGLLGEMQLIETVTIVIEDDDGVDHYVQVPSRELLPAITTLQAFERSGAHGVKVPRMELGMLIEQAHAMSVQASDELRPVLIDLEQTLRDHRPVLDPELRANLRPYQLQGVSWLQLLDKLDFNGLLADDMGLGKTLQTLATLSASALSNPGCSLVVAPNSLVHNWAAESARFLPHWTVMTLEAGEVFPSQDTLRDLSLLVMPFSLVNRHIDALQAVQWQWLVVDESQRIKNASTQLARNLKLLDARRRLALSGTPLENHLGELWSQMDFLMPGLLGNRQQFDRDWRKPIEKQQLTDRALQLAARLRPFMRRRTKSQVALELPPKTEQILRIPMEPDQAQVYETVRALMDRKLRESLATAGFAKSQILFLEALMRLRQVCCDPRLVGSNASSAKHDVLLDMLQTLTEEGRTILVFSQFAEMLSLVADSLKATGLQYLMLTGESKDRASIVDAFNRGDAPVFLLSLKAGGVGLNLTRADTVIVYDPWWNPAAEQQAIDRAHRIGQTQPVTVFRLIADNTIEEKILGLQERKKDLANQMLAGEGLDTALTEDDFRALLG